MEKLKTSNDIYFEYDNGRCSINNNRLKELGEGTEGIVYKYNDDIAIKIYHNYYGMFPPEESFIKELSNIKTNRIILPRKVIKNIKGKTRGYSMKYIEDTDFGIIDFEKEKLIEELELLEEDLNILSNNNVKLGDLREENTIINENGIYLIDSGDYTKDKKNTLKCNKYNFNNFLIDDVLIETIIMKSSNAINGLKLLNELKCKLNNNYSIKEYLMEDMNSNETVKKYVKRKTK